MSVRRVLVGCSVLSLQDACVFYPCCKGCFSRLDAEQRDATRFRCSRCGSRCVKAQLDYRYRLSLRVARDARTFGVTVFGSSLNSFFGIHASGLQRLVETSEEPAGSSSRSTLLAKAVEDCFLGRYFIFGIKVSGTEREPWLEDPDGSDCGRRERAQFVASQMIFPTACGLVGCTVLSYYQRLLQKASECVAESADPSKTFEPFPAPLLLMPGPSPSSSWSGLLSQSLLRPQLQDQAVSPTPPWQQSLGLLTSSAEQEEGSSQDGEDQNSRLTEPSRTLQPVQRVHLQNRPDTEGRTVPLQLECSFHGDPSFTGYSNSSFIEAAGSRFGVKTFFGPSQPRYESCSFTQEKRPINRSHTKTVLSSSFEWDDLPFSESLTEFLCEQDKDLNALGKTPNLNLRRPKQTAGAFGEIPDLSAEPASACLRTAEIISTDKLHYITNTTTADGGGGASLSNQDWRNWAERVNGSEKPDIPQDDEAFLFSQPQEDHSQVEGYNCSADLFDVSLIHTETHKTEAHTVSSPSHNYSQIAEVNDQHLMNETSSVLRSTPLKQSLKSNLCNKRQSIGLHDWDFVPPSQSTPIVKVCALTQSAGSFTRRALKNESSKENFMQRMRSSRFKNKITPGSRIRKPQKNEDRHPAGQPVTLQRGTFNFESQTSTSQKGDTEASNVTVCDCEDGEAVIAPTPPDHKMPLSAAPRNKRLMENDSKDSACETNGEGGACSGLLWGQTRTVSERCVNVSKDHLSDGNHTCDWSRDLFSDSV